MTNRPGKIHVMQITHDLDLGGLQQVVYNICRTIDRDKFELSVLCLRKEGRLADSVRELNVPVYCVAPPPGRTDYFLFRRVASLLRLKNADVIHTHNTQPFIDGTLGAVLAGVRTIIHTDHARQFPDKLRYMLAEKAMSLLSYRVVGCSEHTSMNLHKYERISKRKLITIENGIDPSRFRIEIDPLEKRRQLNIKASGPIIGVAARLSAQKGIRYLIDAMPLVLQRIPNATLVIAGEGELEGELRERTAELNLHDSVRFIGPRNDIPELLKLFTVYVLPSLWEGLPMVILEAMAAGCPVIATDVGGNRRAVEDGVSGSLVKPAHSVELAESILRLLSSPSNLAQFRTAAVRKFEREFSADIMTGKYMKLYQRQEIG